MLVGFIVLGLVNFVLNQLTSLMFCVKLQRFSQSFCLHAVRAKAAKAMPSNANLKSALFSSGVGIEQLWISRS